MSKNYKILNLSVLLFFVPIFKKLLFYTFRFIVDNSSGLVMLRNFHDREIDGVVIWSKFSSIHFNAVNAPQRHLSFTKDHLFSTATVLFFRKKSVLPGLFNQKIQRLNEAGLTEFWLLNIVDKKRTKKSTESVQTLFHIGNLYGVLQICAVSYLNALIVFVLEVISERYPRIQNIIDYLTY